MLMTIHLFTGKGTYVVNSSSVIGYPNNQPTQSVSDVILDYCAQEGLSFSAFARKAHITTALFSEVVTQKRCRPSPKFIAHVAVAMDRDVDDLIWREVYSRVQRAVEAYDIQPQHNFFGADTQTMLLMVLKNTLRDDLTSDTFECVQKQYWRNAPRIVTSYQDDFMYVVSLLPKEKYDLHVGKALARFGESFETLTTRAFKLPKWNTIPEFLALIMAELGVGDMFTLMSIYFRNEVSRYMVHNTGVLFKIKSEAEEYNS